MTHSRPRLLLEQTLRFWQLQAHNVKSIVESARHIMYQRDLESKLNTDPDLLPAPNGMVELRSGKLRAARPDDYFSTVVNVEYVRPGVSNPKT